MAGMREATNYRLAIYDPDYFALYKAVLADPAADLPRLVLADWLEERGAVDRAEFIRVQCEYEHLPPCPSDDTDAFRRMTCRLAHCRRCLFRRRSEELYEDNFRLWFPKYTRLMTSTSRPTSAYFDVRRGFVARWYGTMGEWCGAACRHCNAAGLDRVPASPASCDLCDGWGYLSKFGPAVAAAYPLEQDGVTLADRRSNGWGQGHEICNWSRGTFGHDSGSRNDRPMIDTNRWWLLDALFNALDGYSCEDRCNRFYPNREAADRALGRAALKWAREDQE